MIRYLEQLMSDPLSQEAQLRWQQWRNDATERGWAEIVQDRFEWNADWDLVVDPTGGSSAIRNLSVLMEGLPSHSVSRWRHRAWWSMSDNSLILNALIDRRVCRLVHGHPFSLTGRCSLEQRDRASHWVNAIIEGNPFPSQCVPPVKELTGTWPDKGTIVGGNLSAWEKLTASPWRPGVGDRILLLESLSANSEELPHRLDAVLSSLEVCPPKGVLLGRFSRADREDPLWLERWLGPRSFEFPFARWPLVGHGSDCWSVPLGEEVEFSGMVGHLSS